MTFVYISLALVADLHWAHKVLLILTAFVAISPLSTTETFCYSRTFIHINVFLLKDLYAVVAEIRYNNVSTVRHDRNALRER